MEFHKYQVGELVSEDYRRAEIFKSYNIDFCCGGKKSVEQACGEVGISVQPVIDALNDLELQPSGPRQDYRKWTLDFLCDYIVNTHHTYVKEAIPQIVAFLNKVCDVHGNNHPELMEIRAIFLPFAGELTVHMQKEEIILFPQIKRMIDVQKQNIDFTSPPFGSIGNPIAAMEADHEDAGQVLAKINKLSNGFTPPADACSTYQVTLLNLKQFEDDLHRHVHLENNILYPAAIELEETLLKNKHGRSAIVI